MKVETACSLRALSKSSSGINGPRSLQSPILITTDICGWTAKTPPCACLRKALRPDGHANNEIPRAWALEAELILAQKSGHRLPVEYAALDARPDRQRPLLAIHQQIATR